MPLLKYLPVLSWRDGLQTFYKTPEPLFKQNLPSNLLYKQRKERRDVGEAGFKLTQLEALPLPTLKDRSFCKGRDPGRVV